MTSSVPTVRTIAALRKQVSAWRAEGMVTGLVPTMGALHEGHLSLVRLCQENADRVVVSIFVNPTQFGENEDLGTYPRDEKKDMESLATLDVDLAFMPSATEMYPPGFATSIQVRGLSDVLCGTERPGHFDGVALIVTKLLTAAQPDIAVFGEKDFQQLLIIRRLVADLNLPVRIIGGPIVRESDGLALSSRNVYLSPAERTVAAHFPQVLQAVTAEIEGGTAPEVACANGIATLRAAGFDQVDYLEVRALDDLTPLSAPGRPARVFGAVRIGTTRLIDNWPVGPA